MLRKQSLRIASVQQLARNSELVYISYLSNKFVDVEDLAGLVDAYINRTYNEDIVLAEQLGGKYLNEMSMYNSFCDYRDRRDFIKA